MPIILIGVSVTIFFGVSNRFYTDLLKLREQAESYDAALSNSKDLANARDILTAKYNAIDPLNLDRLQKLLPQNVDNIRLILEIEQLASPYNMVLKDIKYSPQKDETKTTTGSSQTNTPKTGSGTVQGGGLAQATSKDYGVWDLEFSTTGTYNNFLNFTRDLENNLRVVDISSINFSSNTSTGTNTTPVPPSLESYKYDFKIKTYWLKN